MKTAVIRLLAVTILLAQLFGTSLISAQASFIFYFSDSSANHSNQLLVLDSSGQVRNLFAQQNDGYYQAVSPDGNTIAFLRWDWLSTSSSQETLWLGDTKTGAQWTIASAPIGGTVVGNWSPSSQFLLITQLQAIGPLSAGPNYGQLSIYNMSSKSLTSLPSASGLVVGWYPDSQSVLLWTEQSGYVKYHLADQSASTITFVGLNTKTFSWGNISPIAPYLAMPVNGQLNIYNINSGALLQTISQAALGNEYVNRVFWSPDGNQLAIQLNQSDIAIWNYAAGSLSTLITGQFDGIAFNQLRWASDSQHIFVIYDDNSTNVYQAETASGQVKNVYQSPTAAILRTRVNQCVSDNGLNNSLNAKISAEQWNALVNEVQAQTGKKIDKLCADQLIQSATYLLNQPKPTPTKKP